MTNKLWWFIVVLHIKLVSRGSKWTFSLLHVLGSTHYSLFQYSWNLQYFQLLFSFKVLFWVPSSFSFFVNLLILIGGFVFHLSINQAPPTDLILVWYFFCSHKAVFPEELEELFRTTLEFYYPTLKLYYNSWTQIIEAIGC